MVSLHESRHMNGFILCFPYVVLHIRIILDCFSICLGCATQFFADCADIALSSFDLR